LLLADTHLQQRFLETLPGSLPVTHGGVVQLARDAPFCD
jgi:hypothetical protein